MDELLFLDMLNDVEEAEIEENDRENVNIRVANPFIELNGRTFKNIFRLSKDLCNFLIEIMQPLMRPKIKATDLDIPVKILTAVRYFASGSYQKDIGLNMYLNVSQPSVSRCIKEVINVLNHPHIFNHWVKFPQNREELNMVRRKFFNKYNVPGIIGCIDCTHVAIFPPNIEDPNYPEHIYVNRKGYHSINVQLVCDSDLRIINVNARFPGSTNDAFIWNNSNLQRILQQLHGNGHTDYYLLGDSGYPLRTWLMTPLEDNPVVNSPEWRYNIAHRRIRSTIERCNGVLKMRFRCLLKHRVLHYSPDTACKIINACVVLHNLCIHYGIDEEEVRGIENEFDNNIENFNQVDANNEAAQRINPELAAGRRYRTRIINNVFRN